VGTVTVKDDYSQSGKTDGDVEAGYRCRKEIGFRHNGSSGDEGQGDAEVKQETDGSPRTLMRRLFGDGVEQKIGAEKAAQENCFKQNHQKRNTKLEIPETTGGPNRKKNATSDFFPHEAREGCRKTEFGDINDQIDDEQRGDG